MEPARDSPRGTVETRRIGFLGYDLVQALDLIGPSDAFASDAFASEVSERPTEIGSLAPVRPPYEVVIIGLTGKRFVTSSGITMHADVAVPTPIKLDTLIIPGGAGLRRPGMSERAAAWIASRVPYTRRVASVCTGIYGLARTGLLDGRRVATHWSAVADVMRRFPALHVEPDALFLKDGQFYTSAGVTAGIDLALALIEEDHGPRAALAVAREMVVYFKRPGGQQQFSEPLQFQLETADRFADLATWIQSHLRADLSVEVLAARTFLSVRQFSRAFKTRFHTTPAAFVEEARLGEATRRLTAQGANIGSVARSVGYASEDAFRRAFERRFGVSPSNYRRRFGHSSSSFPEADADTTRAAS
jgi:transcriptional regulator GlxA family with amidase domain